MALRRAENVATGAGGGYGLRILAILSALMDFASISTDLYLPALPTMAGVPQSVETAAL